MSTRTLTRQAITEILGRVGDHTAAAIIATGATAEQLMEARQWSIGDSSLDAQGGRPLEGVVAELFDLLTAEQRVPDEDEGRGR